MDYATCVDEFGIQGILTYGRKYVVLAHDRDKGQLKIQGDNQRVRWYPALCFDLTGAEMPLLELVIIKDPLELADQAGIEVEVRLSDGQRRWCFFMTPSALSLCGDIMAGTTARLHYGAPHMIILSTLTAALIEQALQYINAQGNLLACTRAIGAVSLDNTLSHPDETEG